MNTDNACGFGFGLLTGALIGGVIALLYAPRTGKQTRQLIKDTAVDMVDLLKEKADDAMNTVRDTASDANRKGHAAVKALKS
jgi:gas vesicle protein